MERAKGYRALASAWKDKLQSDDGVFRKEFLKDIATDAQKPARRLSKDFKNLFPDSSLIQARTDSFVSFSNFVPPTPASPQVSATAQTARSSMSSWEPSWLSGDTKLKVKAAVVALKLWDNMWKEQAQDLVKYIKDYPNAERTKPNLFVLAIDECSQLWPASRALKRLWIMAKDLPLWLIESHPKNDGTRQSTTRLRSPFHSS